MKSTTLQSKKRITVSLSSHLTAKLDRLVDSGKVRNRSHAVEQLIDQGLSESVDQAVLLAGGSKPCYLLKKINDQYVLSILINQLKLAGINRVVIATNPTNHTNLQAVIGSGLELGLDLVYSLEPEPMGTAGALKYAQSLLDHNPFLVMNDSTLSNLDIAQLIDFHFSQQKLATMVLTGVLAESVRSQVLVQANLVTNIQEINPWQEVVMTNAGIYIFSPELLKGIATRRPTRIETVLLPSLIKKRELSSFIHQDIWHDLSRRGETSRAQQSWLQTWRYRV